MVVMHHQTGPDTRGRSPRKTARTYPSLLMNSLSLSDCVNSSLTDLSTQLSFLQYTGLVPIYRYLQKGQTMTHCNMSRTLTSWETPTVITNYDDVAVRFPSCPDLLSFGITTTRIFSQYYY